MLWTAAEVQAALGMPGFAFNGISIDTRSIQPGDLFVALKDARDGHDFVADALAKGAAGALVSRDLDVKGKLLRVEDSLAALGKLAAFARRRGGAKIVAVTGSVGKTTTKEMLRQTLAAFGKVHAAEASFNNHIGVPLTLARMPRDADFAVIEIGMNHPGEIAPLARLTQPDVAMVTTVERVHIGLMGCFEAIAVEKAALFTGLGDGGAAVLPNEAEASTLLRQAVPDGAEIFSFGTRTTAHSRLLSAKSTANGCDVKAEIGWQKLAFHLNAPGQHMAMNAMAVLAACAALNLDIAEAAAALDGFAPFTGRGARRDIVVGNKPVLLLDESYNASAASMRAAFSVLALQPGRHVAVLGDMLEMGDFAEEEHLGLLPGLSAAADVTFTCGALMRRLFDSLPAAQQGAHEDDAATLAPVVKAALRAGDAVLVKGSYGSRMRDVISHLESAN